MCLPALPSEASESNGKVTDHGNTIEMIQLNVFTIQFAVSRQGGKRKGKKMKEKKVLLHSFSSNFPVRNERQFVAKRQKKPGPNLEKY